MTIILLFHPDLSASRANAALARAAAKLPGVEVVDMTALYPDGHVDDEVETRRLLAAERLVLQFPVHWYSAPPIHQAWADAVLTRMFYVRPEEGAALAGLSMMVAATAGSDPSAYREGAQNSAPLPDLLAPIRATAHRCGWCWAEPILFYGMNRADDAAIGAAARAYAARLTAWAPLARAA